MHKVCFCWCHDTDVALNDAGVDVANAIDAAIACPLCLDMHCDALLDRDADTTRGPRLMDRTPEQRAASWELYLREQRRKEMN